MGMFDRVWFRDDSVRCSEGHSLRDEEFQTKDLGCTVGDAEIRDGRFSFSPGGWDEPVKAARMWICGDCRQCVCFLSESPHAQIYRRFIELVVTVNPTSVTVEDVSKPIAEWLMEDYVKRPGVLGPMSPEVALEKYGAAIKVRQARFAALRQRA